MFLKVCSLLGPDQATYKQLKLIMDILSVITTLPLKVFIVFIVKHPGLRVLHNIRPESTSCLCQSHVHSSSSDCTHCIPIQDNVCTCRQILTLIYTILLSLSTGNGKLDYDGFFGTKIKAKMDDNSYRRFRILARSANQFPVAKHFKDTAVGVEDGNDVTVWCSNDYLGMSKHPEVIKATRFVLCICTQ